MAVDFSWLCFQMKGKAAFSTDGGLEYFSLYAGDPHCFLQPLIQVIRDALGDWIADIIDCRLDFFGLDFDQSADSLTVKLGVRFFGNRHKLQLLPDTLMWSCSQSSRCRGRQLPRSFEV